MSKVSSDSVAVKTFEEKVTGGEGMSSELFDEIYSSTRRIIKDEEYLSQDKVPPRMPHREKELKTLAMIFKPLITKPGETYITAVVSGRQGIGKTHSVIYFYEHGLSKYMKKNHGKDVVLAHVNCFKNSTLNAILASVINNVLKYPHPARGLSPREQMDLIMEKLERKDRYMLLVLDDFHVALQRQGENVINFFMRMYEDSEFKTKRVHVIFIVRDFNMMENYLRDEKAKINLKSRHIHYTPYTASQLYDILLDRAKLALYDSAYDEDVLMEIARYVGYDTNSTLPDAGSARIAIEMLYYAARIAEEKGKSQITIEEVRDAWGLYASVTGELSVVQERMEELNDHQLLLLLALLNLLKLMPEGVPIGRIEAEYRELCEVLGLEPRKHTQVYQYVRDMDRKGIVERVVDKVKDSRGRSSIIRINYPPDALRKKVLEVLRYRGYNVDVVA